MLRLLTPATGCLAAALSVVAVAVATQADAQDSPNASPASLHARTNAVSADIASHFKVFRKARSGADSLTTTAKAMLPDGDSVSGRNNALSRKLRSVDGPAWAIPGDGRICLAVPDAVSVGLACSDNALAERYGVDVETGTVGDPVVPHTALVPDGSTVTIGYADGSAKALVPDSDGVVNARLIGARTATIAGPAGIHTSQLPDPLAPFHMAQHDG